MCRGCHVRNFGVKALGLVILKERVASAFITNGSWRPVAGIDDCLVGQNHKFLMNALHQALVAHPGKIGPANAEIE